MIDEYAGYRLENNALYKDTTALQILTLLADGGPRYCHFVM